MDQLSKDIQQRAAATDWHELYPFESHFHTVGGHKLHYLDEGADSPGAGTPMLMVHGNPTWSFYWREPVLAFRDRYRTIVPDHIGCGLSDKPGLKDYDFRLQRRVDDLVDLIDHLDLKNITLVAHDWGGCIGMGAAVARPERFSRFVLMNTGAFRSNRIPKRIWLGKLPGFGQFCLQGLNLFVRSALRMATERPGGLPPAVQAGLAAPYDSWDNRLAVHRFVLDIPMNPSHPSYATLEKIEKGLPQFADRPSCLIWGMKDWCFNHTFLDRFCEFWPQAEVHRLERAGHYLIEDEPESVIRAMGSFLSNKE
jgi:haloalkane dehalogenase